MGCPYLAGNGFRGQFPHYRRVKAEHIDLLMFQFTHFDEAFCINIAKCPYTGIRTEKGQIIPAEKVHISACPERMILGAEGRGSYHWFKYNPRPAELMGRYKYSFLTMYQDSLLKYKQISDDIIELIKTQGEDWWREPLPVDEEKIFKNNIFHDIQRIIGNL